MKMWPFGNKRNNDIDIYTLFSKWKEFVILEIQKINEFDISPRGDNDTERAMWAALSGRFRLLTMGTTRAMSEFINDEIGSKIKENMPELSRQKKKLEKHDRYGQVDIADWNNEMFYFIDNIVFPMYTSQLTNITSDVIEKVSNWTPYDGVNQELVVILKKTDNFQRLHENFIAWFSETFADLIANAIGEKVFSHIYNEITELANEYGECVELESEIHIEDEQSGINNISPYDYEELCADILNKNGWTAQATKKSGDQGADVYAEKNGISVVLQCKLTNSTVGNKAVQEIISGQKFMSADFAAVVTPAKYTPGAQDIARSAKVLLLHHDDLPHLESLCKRMLS
jgi:HJR/Mrr/RecB family endonuclease